jgi:hypothetical protein
MTGVTSDSDSVPLDEKVKCQVKCNFRGLLALRYLGSARALHPGNAARCIASKVKDKAAAQALRSV